MYYVRFGTALSVAAIIASPQIISAYKCPLLRQARNIFFLKLYLQTKLCGEAGLIAQANYTNGFSRAL